MKAIVQLVFFILLSNNVLSITLDGSWTGKITSNKLECEITFPATVPGGVYTDLQKAYIIPNNLIENNDVFNRWVGNQSVTYSKSFTVPDKLFSAPNIVLIFHGVDTFATIFLNQKKIGETTNMFLKYTFDVKKYLLKTENLLQVDFSSPVKVAETLYNKQALNYTIPPQCVPNTYNGECHVNHIRKMQASFSWDWGPAFPSMGIWKSVEIIPINDVYITDITTDVYKENNFWKVIITLCLKTSLQKSNQSIPCDIFSVIHINETLSISNSSIINLDFDNKSTKRIIFLQVPTDLVHEWWPNGYGNQTLYPLNVKASTYTTLDEKTIRIGFRTVELIQKPLKLGRSFYFQINGVPIFAKGSNFIPASVFPELSAETDTITHLLKSAKEANMNMLRVWGGGLYESELFYNLADEYGIMIWQDFMFACAMYPTTGEFLESVKEELVQNVQRLKNHPSVVLWAGNNENEAALYGNWYGTGVKQIYKTDYLKLYIDVIKKEVEQLDSTRPFVVSSPSNGLHAEEYNYIGENPYSNLYAHYYNYFNNGWDMHQYPRARFSSEYGFQSLPSIYTMLPVANITELDIDGNFLKHRQHLALGILFLKNLISKNLRVPETNNSVRNFENYIYLSQINQAVSLKMQTEFYRQSMSELNEIGEGMTMGALYWQLNDVWQAPSWSSIDFDGRWKMLHYYAVEFFAPVIVTYYVSYTSLSIYIVSDKLYPIKDACLKVRFYNLDRLRTMQEYYYCDISIEASGVTKVKHNYIEHDWLKDSRTFDRCRSDTTAENHCIMILTLMDSTGVPIAPTNYIYPPNLFKSITLPDANISVTIIKFILPGKYYKYPNVELELITDNIAFFVWLEAGNLGGHFSENGFHMLEPNKTIYFYPRQKVTREMLTKYLKVTTLSNIY